ncbi:MAG: hypothetical protein EAY65_02600 [Alphaproteobacteria bacterium]|nr:MAG: hypothetical protein EAY65_02600 [Alphaproteobacteria bacterium]
MELSPVLAIVTHPSETESITWVTRALGYQRAEIVQGTPLDAARHINEMRYNPKYIIVFIGDRKHDVLAELDALAEQCDSHTRVVVIGNANDISFYRSLRDRGIVEYFNYPLPVDEVRNALFQNNISGECIGKVISFIGGGAGDGSSMVALNTAYLLARNHKKRVVLVDLDYQFGMVARQLELQTSYSIKEIFDHPERGVDGTLVERMVVHYRDGMDVIVSPTQLNFMPSLEPEIIRDFVGHLSAKYDYVVLDIPHSWNPWVSSVISFSDHIVLVAQLLLKSITHSSRLLALWGDLGLSEKTISVVVNRSGSRYKEAVHPKDFERILGRPIGFYLPNDIKTICHSENKGVPIADVGKTFLGSELEKIARSIAEDAHLNGGV